MAQIAPPRIGTGKGYFIAGWIALALGVLISAASSPLDSSPAAVGGFLVAVGAGCLAIGFWVKLFGAVERRLIDIQQLLASQGQPKAQPEEGEPSIITGRPAMGEGQY